MPMSITAGEKAALLVAIMDSHEKLDKLRAGAVNSQFQFELIARQEALNRLGDRLREYTPDDHGSMKVRPGV